MKVLGIIPTFNHLDYARGACETFLRYTPQAEVLIVDDGSTEWHKHDWHSWPRKHVAKHRFEKNDRNLTRSWNCGLLYARVNNYDIAVLANSDVLFTEGWFNATSAAFKHGFDLVGPLTNAPGPCRHQRVTHFIDDYRLTDDQKYLNRIALQLRTRYRDEVRPETVNGFCMTAPTKAWWSAAHNEEEGDVFDPRRRMVGNEDEFLYRFKRAGKKCGVTLGAFVWHYRGVSRDKGGAGKFRKGRR